MIVDDALPGIKLFFKATTLKANTVGMLTRLVAAFTCHLGRMSAAQAAGSIRSQARHRAALVRFLAQVRWSRDWAVLTQVADLLLQGEGQRQGTWIFIVDQTYCGQQGKRPRTRSAERITDRGRKRVTDGRRNTPSVRAMVLSWGCC